MTDPLGSAIKEITESRRILESLITSSETFDYPKAKAALKALQLKIKDLTRLQQEMQKTASAASVRNISVVDFTSKTPVQPGMQP